MTDHLLRPHFYQVEEFRHEFWKDIKYKNYSAKKKDPSRKVRSEKA